MKKKSVWLGAIALTILAIMATVIFLVMDKNIAMKFLPRDLFKNAQSTVPGTPHGSVSVVTDNKEKYIEFSDGIETIIEVDTSEIKQQKIRVNFLAKGISIPSEKKVYCQIYQNSCLKNGSSSMIPLGNIMTLIVIPKQEEYTMTEGTLLLNEITAPDNVINVEKIISIFQMAIKTGGEMKLINEKQLEIKPVLYKKSKLI